MVKISPAAARCSDGQMKILKECAQQVPRALMAAKDSMNARSSGCCGCSSLLLVSTQTALRECCCFRTN